VKIGFISETIKDKVKNHKAKYLEIEDSIYGLTFISLIRNVRKKHELHSDDVHDYFFKSTQVFFIQVAITSLIMYSAIEG
jgi:hypothetical protein